MAEVRKGKSEVSQRARRRVGTSAVPQPKSSMAELKRILLETQDQLSLVHGVLEELCERQEAMSAWQMEFSKRLVTLQEAQWRSLEDLAGIDMGSPVEKAFGVQLDGADLESLEDQFDDAQKMMEQINSEAMPKRATRLRKRKENSRVVHTQQDSSSDRVVDGTLSRETSPESVYVIPVKVDVH